MLSLIAIASHDTLNRDGMLYVDTARIFLQDGFPAALKSFPWPFFPILIAIISQLTGLGLETIGHTLNVLFMAGACALLVASSMRVSPQTAWMTCLVILAIPGVNEYRNELVREYGCWFFVMLALWLALCWNEHPRWLTAMMVQASLVIAALFRPEALAIFPALILWQLFAAPKNERGLRLLMIGTLPLLGLATLIGLYLANLLPSSRLSADISRLKLGHFSANAQALSSVLPEYAKDQARTILFFGSLSIIPLKFISKLGVLIIPLLYALRNKQARFDVTSRFRIFSWMSAAHLTVLIFFVLGMQFLAGRYIALLLVLSAPLTGYGLWQLTQHFPRWKPLMLLAAILLMFGNVVSTNPGKSHFREAGKWLSQNAIYSPSVYVESSRAAYYAGWDYSRRRRSGMDRTGLAEAVARGEITLAVFEVSDKNNVSEVWLHQANLVETHRFTSSNKSGEAIIIAVPNTPSR